MGCSANPALMAELGEEVLLARDGDCRPEATSAAVPVGWVRPNGSTPRGEAPRTPDEGVPAAWLSGREASSDRGPRGKKAGLSLPYRARCWRARRSRRLSSLTAAGLLDRSDLFADISARRPLGRRKRIKTTAFETMPNQYIIQGRRIHRCREEETMQKKKKKK